MKIKDNVHLLNASKGSYVYLITGEENVLVDTGLSFKGKMILKEINDLGINLAEIKHILLTHHDMDHIGNLEMLQQRTGAEIWASQEDIPYIYGDIDRSSFKKYLKYVFKTNVPRIIKPYVSGQSINGIEAIPTPGHTPGHVCLRYQDILFAGDLLHNKKGKLEPYPKVWNWNNERMMESVEKVTDIPVQWICPAHGEPLKGSFGSRSERL